MERSREYVKNVRGESLYKIPTIPTNNMVVWYQLKVYQHALGLGWAHFSWVELWKKVKRKLSMKKKNPYGKLNIHR